MNPVREFARRLPPSLIGWAGRVQFEHPILGPPLRLLARAASKGEATIAHGPAAGLKIDSAGYRAGFALGTADASEQRWIQENLQPGDVFCDAGAAIGFTLVAAAVVGQAGEVVSFEPLPQNAEQLRRNIARNDLSQVDVIEAALSSNSGTSEFFIGDDWDHARIPRDGDAGNRISVATTTLDEVFANRRMPKAIKLDIEGAEIEALKGAAEVLKHRPCWLIEIHWIEDAFRAYFRDHIEPLGYTMRVMDGRDIETVTGRFHVVLAPH